MIFLGQSRPGGGRLENRLNICQKMAWALWQAPRHRAAKMHVHFDVLKGVATEVTLTAGQDSERDQLRATLQAGGFDVVDRGYRDWDFFPEILQAGAYFGARVQDDTVIHSAEERPVTAAAAGVLPGRGGRPARCLREQDSAAADFPVHRFAPAALALPGVGGQRHTACAVRVEPVPAQRVAQGEEGPERA